MGIFGLEFQKILSHLKSAKKQKCLNLGQKFPYLGILDWNFQTVLSCLRLAPSNLSNCKILQKKKNSKFGNKNALFGYFWPKIS